MQNICITSGEGDTGLFKIKHAFKSRLTWYMVGCVVIAGVVAFLAGYLIVHWGRNYVDGIFDDQDKNRNLQMRYIKDLQNYITKMDITTDTISQLKNWTDENSYVYLAVYQNNKVVFNSDYTYDENLETEVAVGDVQESEYLYQLKLTDKRVVSADIFCYDYWKYYYYIWGAGIIIGVFLFIIVITMLLQKKVRYINSIVQELQILEGGNLEYPITVKGNDEVANLALGIDQMRLSIMDNMKKEQRMMQVNKDLVTSMSHDLRTPLTILNGYLEILNMDHIKDEEQRKHYLELSLARIREIKELSDDLFEYFLIYGENEKRIDVEAVPACMLAEDLIENQFLGLEEAGYQFTGVNRTNEQSGNCMVNIKYMQRVLNNIISNLEKYADKDIPIEVSASVEENFMVIRVRNGIRKNLDEHESTKIGLITCDRIMKLHHGEFKKYEAENEFTVQLVIPMEIQDR